MCKYTQFSSSWIKMYILYMYVVHTCDRLYTLTFRTAASPQLHTVCWMQVVRNTRQLHVLIKKSTYKRVIFIASKMMNNLSKLLFRHILKNWFINVIVQIETRQISSNSQWMWKICSMLCSFFLLVQFISYILSLK